VPRLRSGYIELTLVLSGTCALGCGRIGDGVADGSPAWWCEEAGSKDGSEVRIEEPWEDGVEGVRVVIVTDREGRMLVRAIFTDSDSLDMRDDYTLDDHGSMIEARSDEDGDGVVDRVATVTNDDEGRPLVSSIDDGNDGTVDTVTTWDYTTPGQEVSSVDQGADGVPEVILTVIRGENGEIVRQEYDENADGVPEQVQTSTYTESGQLLEVTEEGDIKNEVSTYEYDSEDRLIRHVLTDDQSVSTPVTEETFEYDDAGRLVAISTDSDQDGVPNEVERRTYDAEGREVRRETTDATGELRSLEEYEYDEGATPARTRSDYDGDGEWDWVMTRTACD